MTTVLPPVCGLLISVLFALTACTSWRWKAKDRLKLLTSGFGAAVLLFAVQRVSDWSQYWLLTLWWAAVLALAIAAVGAALRWPGLPWLHTERHKIRRRTFAGIDLVVLTAIVVFFA
jgi:peptidoglycan/LPS O-acetylase OafA/YrhL